MVSKRRRGTVIIDTPNGILVVSHDSRTFFLPGGGAERGESRRDAAIRELREETNLLAVDCFFLFEYPSFTDNHKVFLVESTGVPKPGNEIKYLDFFNGSNLKVSNTTWEIIKLYNLNKKAEKEAALARTKSANEPLK